MPDLKFQVTGVKAAARGLAPLLHFEVKIRNPAATEAIHAVILHAQIQYQSPQRSYNDVEKENLVELFGTPEHWNRNLRNRLWGHSDTTVSGFTQNASAILPMACTFDINVAAAKYFHGLEDGEIPLLFLFTGSIFYQTSGGRLQIQPISGNQECVYRMPLRIWREMMEKHFPNSAWLSLPRGVFDRLCTYKRRGGFTTWEEAIDVLLAAEPKPEELAV